MKTYMNPHTGSVDTLDGWNFDTDEEAKLEGLVEVVKDENGEWVEK